MIKKFIIVVIAFAGLSATAQNSLLWKISGNGLDAPSYLYGTIHVTCDATLDATTKTAMDKTQQLYLELDMDDPSMMTAMMTGMMMKDGNTMSALASAEDFALVDAYLTKNLGISAKMFDSMKPFMISTMLLPSLMNCPMQSVEDELMKLSKAQGEEIFGLETVAEQLAIFDAIPYKEQMDELVESVKNQFVDEKKQIDEMFRVYAAKDLNAMLELVDEEDGIMAAHQDKLLADRNIKWIPKIGTIAKQKPTFFGVGAAHLAGENGVIALLRKAGFTVEAVN